MFLDFLVESNVKNLETLAEIINNLFSYEELKNDLFFYSYKFLQYFNFSDDKKENFLNDILNKLKQGVLQPDIILWLWHKIERKKLKTFLTHSLFFRSFSYQGHKIHINSKKKLRDYLFNNVEFQNFICGNDEREIVSFLSCLDNLSQLETSHRSTLKVKLARIIPKMKQFISKKTSYVSFNLPKVTSYKSYKEKAMLYDNIRKKQMPENEKAINIAKDFGDLKENSEFKAAKELQKILRNRAVQIEQELASVSPTDFSNFKVNDLITIATSFTIKNMKTNKESQYHILGLWDGNPDKNYISFDAPLAKEFIGKKVNDNVILPSKEEVCIIKVEGISSKILEEFSDGK